MPPAARLGWAPRGPLGAGAGGGRASSPAAGEGHRAEGRRSPSCLHRPLLRHLPAGQPRRQEGTGTGAVGAGGTGAAPPAAPSLARVVPAPWAPVPCHTNDAPRPPVTGRRSSWGGSLRVGASRADWNAHMCTRPPCLPSPCHRAPAQAEQLRTPAAPGNVSPLENI